MIRIVTISDTHNQHLRLDVPKSGDLIIHAGDMSSRGSRGEIEHFLQWYGGLQYEMKVLVAGNHDFSFESHPDEMSALCDHYGVTLLNDSGVTFHGLKLWGSPVQPEFCNWAFNRARTKKDSSDFCHAHDIMQDSYRNNPNNGHLFIGTHWDKIPHDIDILITHGPPLGILDRTHRTGSGVGCELLAKKIQEIKPILHVFGHIHEARGVVVDVSSGNAITYANASSLDRNYQPYDVPVFAFNWDNLITGQSRGYD